MRRLTHAVLASMADAGDWRALWQQAVPIVRQMVAQMRREGRIPPHLDDDALQAAYLAAGQAVRLWNPMEAALSTHLTRRVRGAVLRVLQQERAVLAFDDETDEGSPALESIAYEDPPAGYDDPLAEAMHLEAERRVHAGLARLPSRADVEILSSIYGLTGKPVPLEVYAVQHGLSRRDAYYRLSAAKARLAEQLGGVGA